MGFFYMGRKESLEQKEYAQYPIEKANRYKEYRDKIELKKQQQIELIITEIKNNLIQYGMSS